MKTGPKEATATVERGAPKNEIRGLIAEIRSREAQIRQGGGAKGIERQHKLGRRTARERIDLLADRTGAYGGSPRRSAHGSTHVSTPATPGTPGDLLPTFLEFGLWAGEKDVPRRG